MEIFLALLGLIVLIPLLFIYSVFSWGYVSYVIYEWFIIPTIPNAPVLNWIQLASFMFFINCFIHYSDNSDIKDEYKTEKWGRISLGLLRPWLLLLGAWIFKCIFI